MYIIILKSVFFIIFFYCENCNWFGMGIDFLVVFSENGLE